MKVSVSSIAIVLVAFAACADGKNKSASPRADRPVTPKAPNKTQPGETEPVTPTNTTDASVAAISTTEVLALVQSWVDAQNSGDFDAYSASYARRLTGIKRVGSKVRNYDREGWLKDRKRMFRKEMKVQALKLDVRSTANSASVRFTQNWSSGSFQDTGLKQLIIVFENKALKIAREEMLSSTVVGSTGPQGGLHGSYFRALELDGFILGSAESSWAAEKSILSEKSGKPPYIAIQNTVPESLPEQYQHLIGTRVTVQGQDGACQDTIKKLKIVSGNTPHFGYFQNEMGESHKVSDAKLARDIPRMSNGYVMAVLGTKCKGMVLQLEAGASSLAVAKLTDNKMASDNAWSAFVNTTEYKQFQKEYDTDEDLWNGKGAKWHKAPTIRVFDDVVGKRTLVVVASEGGYGCGGFIGSMSIIYAINSKGKLTTLDTIDGFVDAEMVVDIDGDGEFEFVGSGDSYRPDSRIFVLGKGDDGYGELHSFAWDYQDCDC